MHLPSFGLFSPESPLRVGLGHLVAVSLAIPSIVMPAKMAIESGYGVPALLAAGLCGCVGLRIANWVALGVIGNAEKH